MYVVWPAPTVAVLSHGPVAANPRWIRNPASLLPAAVHASLMAWPDFALAVRPVGWPGNVALMRAVALAMFEKSDTPPALTASTR